MGRWTSPDPTGLALSDPGNPQTLNLYAYVSNHPLTSIDPDGLSWFNQAPCSGTYYAGMSLGGKVKNFFANLFANCGGGGGGGGGDDGGWSPTPHRGKNLVNVHYPLGAGVIGGHVSVGTYDSEDPDADPHAAFGFTTVNQHWYVRTLLIVGYPFLKGWMEPDSHSPRSKNVSKN
jgi:hypothetical protein